jgi:hypothetical protein
VTEDEIPIFENFFTHLRFYPLPPLVLRFATIAKAKSPEYDNAMVMCQNLQGAASALLNSTTFTYRSGITCDHHIIGENAQKIDHCCLNVALRSVFLILAHFVKPYKLPPVDGHDIEKLIERTKAAREAAASRTSEVPKKESRAEAEPQVETVS